MKWLNFNGITKIASHENNGMEEREHKICNPLILGMEVLHMYLCNAA